MDIKELRKRVDDRAMRMELIKQTPERYPLGTKWRDATTSYVADLVKMGVLSGLVE